MSTRAKIQSFGGFLTAMVLPNIGAFIAWGLLTALFIPTGWLPNEHLAKMVGPMITYLLPLLIAYTGGSAIGGQRGGVIGAISAMGIIVGADIPMFMGAMIIGPVAGYVIKKFDALIEGKIPSGFEMIVNNFSIGIFGMILSIISYEIVGPIILFLNNLVTDGINVMVHANLLPLLSIINEPAKILFLNNAIDQGIYSPLGVQEAAKYGQSIFFMVASSPGPGLGLLLAFALFGKGMSKKSAPSAMIIHFLGGIHELYFPYVLMKPKMIIGMILGGMSGIVTFKLLGAGLVAFPSPGSIFSFLAMTPRGGYLATIAGVFSGAVVSFLVSSILLKFDKAEIKDEEFEISKELTKELKGKKTETHSKEKEFVSITPQKPVNFIVFACDAGMGSSAMGASVFQNKLKKVNLGDIKVINCAIEKIPKDVDIVVLHENLYDRGQKIVPDAEFVKIKNYINDPQYNQLLDRLVEEKSNQEEFSTNA